MSESFPIRFRSQTLLISLCLLLTGIAHSKPEKHGIIELQVRYAEATPFSNLIYGVNNEWVHLPYSPDTPQFIDVYKELGVPTFRYPAGTASNYLNMTTGFAEGWPGMAEGNAKRVADNNATLKRRGKEHGVDIRNYIRFIKATDATSNYILNVSSMTLEENRRVLNQLKASGINIQHFELGNELYHGTYATAFPSPEDYLTKGRIYVQMVKQIFPQAKVAVVVHPYFFIDEMDIDGLRTSSKRLRTWYDVLQKEDFFDAVAVHMYAYTGMDHKTVEMLPYLEVYANACMNADQTADSTIDRLASDFPGKEIWVTEYHVGGFSTNLRKYRMRYSYLGALYNTGFMLRLFSHPEVTLSSWHAIPQWIDPVISSDNGSMQEGDFFKTKVTFDFFKQFRDPVKLTNQLVPVHVLRKAGSKPSANFMEFQAAVFLNPKTGDGYLVVLNKQDADHSLDTTVLENALSGKLIAGSALSPSLALPLDKALASEDQLMKTDLDIKADGISIKPFSVTLLQFQKD
ncbi:MAG: hypothetical protein AB3N63_00990 [Puniceicoccaceae bacterium]